MNKTIWHFNRSLWKTYNERRGVSVSHRPLPPNYKKVLCTNVDPDHNPEICTYAHGPEELKKYRQDCQVRN